MLSDFFLPVIAYVVTLLVLWATLAISKAVAARFAMPQPRPLVMVGTRTQ
jgi:hypothetical protein